MRIILDIDNEQNFVDLWNPERNNWERYIKCEEKEMCHKCHKYPCEYNQTYCEFCLGISEEDKKIETIEYDRDCTVEWDFKELYDKINEIIDVLNEMREDK